MRRTLTTATAVLAFGTLTPGPAHGQQAVTAGAFDTPHGADAASPLAPGQEYRFEISAMPGARLSLATMFVQSNDWFYAPGQEGIFLFDAMGEPVRGDVTDHLLLWDAGTEEDQEPGAGPHQAPRQSGPDVGEMDMTDQVRRVDGMAAPVPTVPQVLRVTVHPDGARDDMGVRFRVTVANVATDVELHTMEQGMQPILLSPGVWVVHGDTAPLFAAGETDRGHGLEALAEDGNPVPLATALTMKEGM